MQPAFGMVLGRLRRVKGKERYRHRSALSRASSHTLRRLPYRLRKPATPIGLALGFLALLQAAGFAGALGSFWKPDWPGHQSVGRNPSGVPSLKDGAAYSTFDAADLAAGSHSFRALI